MAKASNQLFYGDNLEVLRNHVGDESVDLIYLDPPFKSDQDYNVLFKEHSGERAAAQIKAFKDTWRWDVSAEAAYSDVLARGGRVALMLGGLRGYLGESDMMAYLAMMAPRLVELRRVLRPTGSIYLHCDPTASHYLKLLMDSVFGGENFRNEIVWERTAPKGHASTRFATAQDSIFFYARSKDAFWNPQFAPHGEDYKASHYGRIEEETGRRYMLDNCLNPNPDRPNLTYEWNGHTRVWRWTRARMKALHEEGRIVHTRSGLPRYKRYLDESKGKPLTSVWTDIPPINSQAQERLGYPTQKPEALLERILLASSDEGQVVLDPFCGCGTAIAVAQRLKRRWIGIDITHLAIGLIKHRLRDAFGGRARYEVHGEPVSVPDARALADLDRFQFQWWALGLVGARPVERKKGADRGVDGRLFFQDEAGGRPKQAILSVKSGAVGVADVRDLRGVVEREGAAIGALLTLEPPTRPMIAEAAAAGFYDSPGWNRRYPRIQIRTIEQLLAGEDVEAPPANVTHRRAPRADKGSASEEGPSFV